MKKTPLPKQKNNLLSYFGGGGGGAAASAKRKAPAASDAGGSPSPVPTTPAAAGAETVAADGAAAAAAAPPPTTTVRRDIGLGRDAMDTGAGKPAVAKQGGQRKDTACAAAKDGKKQPPVSSRARRVLADSDDEEDGGAPNDATDAAGAAGASDDEDSDDSSSDPLASHSDSESLDGSSSEFVPEGGGEEASSSDSELSVVADDADDVVSADEDAMSIAGEDDEEDGAPRRSKSQSRANPAKRAKGGDASGARGGGEDADDDGDAAAGSPAKRPRNDGAAVPVASPSRSTAFASPLDGAMSQYSYASSGGGASPTCSARPSTSAATPNSAMRVLMRGAAAASGSTATSTATSTPAASSSSSPSTSGGGGGGKDETRHQWLLNRRDKQGRAAGDPDYDPRTLFVPRSELAKLSQFEQQFWEIKSDHMDTVIFFQKGKFYELYEDDATIGHRHLDLKMTDRVNMRMVGVPESAFEMWASKLIALGYKVGRVDQVESSLKMQERSGGPGGKGKGKGTGRAIIRRELQTILTCGTLVDEDMIATPEAKYLMSIKCEPVAAVAGLGSGVGTGTGTGGAEGAESLAVGICYVDAATGRFHVGQFVDDGRLTQLETVLTKVRPVEIIYERGVVPQRAVMVIKSTVPHAQVTRVQPGAPEFPDASDTAAMVRDEGYFSDTVPAPWFLNTEQGQQQQQQQQDEQGQQEQQRQAPQNLLISAFGGIVTYLKRLMRDRALLTGARFTHYDALVDAGTLLLDGHTLNNLDILDATGLGGQRVAGQGSLLHYVNRTVTPMGRRAIRQWLCHPLRRPDDIRARQGAVKELMGNATLREAVRSVGWRFPYFLI
jgi:hypothetical protein